MRISSTTYMVCVFFFKGDFPSCSWLGLVTFEREIERGKEREKESCQMLNLGFELRADCALRKWQGELVFKVVHGAWWMLKCFMGPGHGLTRGLNYSSYSLTSFDFYTLLCLATTVHYFVICIPSYVGSRGV